MKFTLSWLKEHLQTDQPLGALVEKLTMIGLEVESLDDKLSLAPFVIARVVSAAPHPNADRLRVCLVDTGCGDPVQVVCGAPNAKAGMKGVFAPAGTHIPGTKVDLKPGVIRGVESNGMLCSERELELSEDHDAIIELPEEAPVGVSYSAWAALDDPVIEIGITPNRPDCLGVYGIARDLAAAGMGKLVHNEPKAVVGSFECPVAIDLEFSSENEAVCPLFVGRLVRGVNNGESPQWMQKRLRAIGLRPINALVDITNYITFDKGRPLHVYDADKLSGSICVRMGRAGERFKALDGKTYNADATTCVIADERSVLGFGGIIGGEDTGCDEHTKNVFIESACFDPITIAHTGRRLGIVSDARYRFERGIDPEFTAPGAELATQMVLDICGGQASHIQKAGEVKSLDKIIEFPVSDVKRLTGLEISAGEIRALLTCLGFWVSGLSSDILKVAVPSWRPDVEGKADLVEEVLRITGIDQVESVPLPFLGGVVRNVLSPLSRRTRNVKRFLAARGLNESVNWSFISAAKASRFGSGSEALRLVNPLSPELSDMRPSLIPGLLDALHRNANRGFADGALFEVGQIFKGDTPQDQFMSAAGMRRATACASGAGRHWHLPAQQVSLYDAKADLFAAIQAAGFQPESVQIKADVPDWLHPGRSGCVQLGAKNILGFFGEIHPLTLKAFNIEDTVVGFELTLDAIPYPKARTKTRSAHAFSDLMPIRRDFAFLLDENIAAEQVTKAAKAADKTLITAVTVFDVFRGKNIAEGKKSLAIEVTMQPREKTLTDEEINAVCETIIQRVTKATGGELRV